jgi:hypothetical protein
VQAPERASTDVFATSTHKQGLCVSHYLSVLLIGFWGEEAGRAVAGLVVLGAALVVGGVAVTVWAVVDVLRTSGFVLYLEGWHKPVWLLIACVPVVGAAYWIRLARPRPGIERIVPTGWISDSDGQPA